MRKPRFIRNKKHTLERVSSFSVNHVTQICHSFPNLFLRVFYQLKTNRIPLIIMEIHLSMIIHAYEDFCKLHYNCV